VNTPCQIDAHCRHTAPVGCLSSLLSCRERMATQQHFGHMLTCASCLACLPACAGCPLYGELSGRLDTHLLNNLPRMIRRGLHAVLNIHVACACPLVLLVYFAQVITVEQVLQSMQFSCLQVEEPVYCACQLQAPLRYDKKGQGYYSCAKGWKVRCTGSYGSAQPSPQ
jgi:hypothetical protein